MCMCDRERNLQLFYLRNIGSCGLPLLCLFSTCTVIFLSCIFRLLVFNPCGKKMCHVFCYMIISYQAKLRVHVLEYTSDKGGLIRLFVAVAY
jgi:hypothetical protein